MRLFFKIILIFCLIFNNGISYCEENEPSNKELQEQQLTIINSLLYILDTSYLLEPNRIIRANLVIKNISAGTKGSGTHIKVAEKSYILSCAHMVHEEDDLFCAVDTETGDFYKIYLTKIDKDNDLALFSFEVKEDLPYLEIAEYYPALGDKVFAVGNPGYLSDIITEGIIASHNYLWNQYLTTNKVFHGNSGGALIYNNQLVGVVIAYKKLYQFNYSSDYPNYDVQDESFVLYTVVVDLETIKDFLSWR